MRHLSGSIIAFVLFCSTVLAEYTPISRRGGIHLVSELVPPPSGGQEKFHTIEFPGPISNYAITSDVYAKRLHSSATCGKVMSDEKYLCVTSTRQHDQIFSISCLQPSNEQSYADIEFLRSGDVMVSGNGTIYAGFTNDQSNVLKMLQGPDKPIDANGDDVGVIINCVDNQRQSPDVAPSQNQFTDVAPDQKQSSDVENSFDSDFQE